MLKTLKILYAEDEESTRNNLSELLQLMCDNVTIVSNGQEALTSYNKEKPDIIIADIEMPFLNGLDFAQRVRECDHTTQIIITTAYTNTEYFLKAVELNLVKYLVKPVTLKDLKDALNKALKNIRLNKEPIFNLPEGFSYNLLDRTLSSSDGIVKITNHELLFLELLLKNSNRVVNYEEIEINVWNYEYEVMTSSALRSLVRDLRKKLPVDTIENISKVGYKIKLCN